MVCVKLLLTDILNDSKKLHELFEDKKEIVFYEGIEDCIHKLNYYANNSEEREQIALSGKEKVLNYHTQTQRVNIIMQEFLNK
jgi:spore maturation protein CgeB